MGSGVERKSPFPRGLGRLGLGLLALASIAEAARAEPPIKSQQDAYCRDVARSRVFATPDPQNLGPHEVGRRIYQNCMTASAGPRRRPARRRGRR